MKITGLELGPREKTLVIPFGENNVVFKARTVTEEEDFEKIYPKPLPPLIQRRGGQAMPDPNDKDYDVALTKWATAKFNWVTLKSLEATEGLVWDTVDMADPDTWDNFQDELRKAGFSIMEVQRIIGLTFDANGLNSQMIDEATDDFLAGRLQVADSVSFQNTAPNDTPSGEPVSDAE